jgi:hypothetical protein
MAGDGDDGSSVALAGSEASIEQADVAFTVGAQMRRTGSGLDEGPLQIAVDVAAGSTVPDMTSRGDNARDEACVTGEVLGSGEALDVADLQPQDGSQDRKRVTFPSGLF